MKGIKNPDDCMPNRNYLKGRAKEYRTMRKYEKLGYICLRTAGSHGFADIIAIKHGIDSLNDIIFIQCKPKNYSQRDTDRLYAEHRWITEISHVKFIVE